MATAHISAGESRLLFFKGVASVIEVPELEQFRKMCVKMEGVEKEMEGKQKETGWQIEKVDEMF